LDLHLSVAMAASTSTMKITLSHPVEIEGDWEYSWFDSAHQHFLLLNDSYFYLLSYNDAVPTPKLFAHIRDLPQNLLCGRVSLDKKLVAIQTSLSSITVIDIASKKKWIVDIRYASDNAVLPGGVIWSDHGGNSEDLVLATSRGLELYKISQVRNQCKLSRVVSQHASSFWYNAEHRMIMLAAHAQTRHNTIRNPQSVFFTPDERPKEMLLIDGYFLNCEKPSIPMLELPPPDKVPRLEVGPGLTVDDVALVSIYGKILCLVRYVEHGLDFITVYHMTKLKAERLHCLSLDCPTNGLLFSVYDNLLVCHCIGERVSVVFDVLSTTARSQEGIASREKTHPLGTASAMHYIHKHKGGAATSTSPRGSMEGRRSSAGQLRNSFTASAAMAAAEESARASKAASSVLSTKSSSTVESDWGPLVTPQKHPSRLGNSFLVKKESDITHFESLAFGGEISSTTNTSTASTPVRGDHSYGPEPQYTVLSTPELTQEVYGTYTFEYLPPNRLLDQHRRLVWEIKCHFPGIVREMTQMAADSREVPLFLSRRGLRYARQKQSADGQLEYHKITQEGRLAKQLLLGEMYNLLIEQKSLGSLRTYFRSLMRPYGAEYRRLVQVQFDLIHSAENLAQASAGPSSGATSALTPSHPTIFSMSATTRRRAMAESLFRSATNKRAAAGSSGFGNNMGVYPGLLSIAGVSSPSGGTQQGSDTDSFATMEVDTLELAGTMQLLLPDISMVGVRARKLQFLQQRALAKAASESNLGTVVDSAAVRRGSIPGNKIKPTCQPVVLNTRRDACGGLICTQAEIISHVWLPLLLNSDVDFEYLSCALAVFIAHLRESNVSVAPAFSAVLLNVLFHSSRYMEVGRMLQQRALPDSIELALYSLEFCDMLEDLIENTLIDLKPLDSAETSFEQDTPVQENLSAPPIAPPKTEAVTPSDQLERHRTALGVTRQSALDVLWRLDERVTVVKWHLSHGEVLRALAHCKKKGGAWQAPLLPGSIPGCDFFSAAVSAVAALQGVSPSSGSPRHTPQKSSRPPSQLDVTAAAEEVPQSPLSPRNIDPKEIQRAKDKKAAVNGSSTALFYAVYLFLREWDNASLLTTPMVRPSLFCFAFLLNLLTLIWSPCL